MRGQPAHQLHLIPPRLVLMGAYLAAMYAMMIAYIAPTFGYLGFTYRSPALIPNALVVCFVLLLTILMPSHLGRPSRFVLWMQFVLAAVPSMVVPQFTEGVSRDEAFMFAIVVGLLWLMVLGLTSVPVVVAIKRSRVGRIKIPAASATPQRARRWTNWLVAFSVMASVVLVSLFGASGAVVGLTEVSAVRLAYRETLAVAPAGTAYVLLTASNVINPLALIRTALERRWVLAVIPVMGQLLIYSIGGHRMVLLSVPGVLAIYVWMRKRPLPSATAFLGWVSVGIVSAAVALLAFGVSVAGLLAMRTFVAPGNLAAAYVGIFSSEENLYWSYSFFSWLLDYPYALTPNFLVGAEFRGSETVSANVNLFGDGYIAWGWTGMTIECLLLVVLVLLLDGAARGVAPAEFCTTLLLPSFALANSNVFTSFLTHGFLVAYLVLLITGRSGSSDVLRKEEVTHEAQPVLTASHHPQRREPIP